MSAPTAARSALWVLAAFPPLYVLGLLLAYSVLAGVAPGSDPVAPGWQVTALSCPVGAALGWRSARRRTAGSGPAPARAVVAGATGMWLLLTLLSFSLYYFPRPATLATGALTGPLLAHLAVAALARRGTDGARPARGGAPRAAGGGRAGEGGALARTLRPAAEPRRPGALRRRR